MPAKLLRTTPHLIPVGKISNALIGLGADASVISKLKTENMDPDMEEYYQDLLREWKKDDDSIKEKIDAGVEGMLEFNKEWRTIKKMVFIIRLPVSCYHIGLYLFPVYTLNAKY